MWSQTCFFVLSAVLAYAADDVLYKSCSQVNLCKQNRELEKRNRFNVNPEAVAVFAKGLASFRVQNVEEREDFFLNVTALEGNIFRLQVEERESVRYHIQHVLDGDPTPIKLDKVQFTLQDANIIVGNNRVIVNYSPLSVEFYENEVLQFVVEGDRLTLENEDLRHPFTFGVTFPQASHLYGLHEHSDHLALRTTEPNGADPYRVRTIDYVNYELYSTMAMYGAIPALYGHGFVFLCVKILD
jgi:hypothetical protein